MTIRISLVRALPNRHWVELNILQVVPLDWHLDLAFLKYLWELGEVTILETAFYEPFEKSNSLCKENLTITFGSLNEM
jgi:hypothetical protein